MIQLLKAELFRLKHETSFIVVALIYLAANILSVVVYSFLGSAVIPDASAGGIMLATNSINNLGLFVAIAVSLFNGREFKYNTVRNKITAGCKREHIFFSTFIVNQIMYVILFLIGSLTVLGMGSFMLPFSFGSLFALDMLMMLLLGAAFCALITLFSFATQKTSSAMLIGILVCAAAYSLFMFMTDSFLFDFVSNAVDGTEFNYAFLEAVSRINIFSMDYCILKMPAFVAAGSDELFASFITGIYINAAAVAVVWTGLAAVGGWLVFRRADIK